ncbi:hypothetical protein J2Z69_000803 [Paenibacillus shirakamiensis]|uniref:Uncharacterized protein n=1 Tax=Paenibacillus shirakamiensis TaxID=1265935 RepID=A0ABS4JGU4_9BACL|nr:hypothetical protein [Paenibacillus shirakamiensis]MBP1999784.1 hypothetical protein [Paenibacillus shirakamiensis]
MSRSFEKQVERNKQKLLMKQKKMGIAPSKVGIGGEGETFQGRNFILPIVLILFAAGYAMLGTVGAGQQLNFLYYLTIGLYVLLAVVTFMRKPYLRVTRNALYTSKFNRDRIMTADNIQKIILTADQVTILPKGKSQKWVFYRSRNRFNTAAMGERLVEFGKVNNLMVENH